MKTFRIVIEDSPLKNAIKALKKVAKTGIPDVRLDELICGSVELAHGAFTRARLEAFYTILRRKPGSIRSLAELMGKSHANVLRDVRALELMGIIELVSEKKGERESLRPIAKYGSIIFDFEERKKVGNE